jgi:integrase
MPLSEAKARNAKPQTKPYKITDYDGMFLLITPAGGKYWRLKYYYGGKEKLLALGVYPEVSLADARERRAKARKTLAAGNDPGEVKKESKRQEVLRTSDAFETVAREWMEKRRNEWAPSSLRVKIIYLENYLLPKLGPRPITAITASEVLELLRGIEAKGTLDTARRVMQMCGQIFMYGIATGRAERNPVPDLRGALKTPVVQHHAYLKAKELPDFLQALDAYDGKRLTKLALRLLLLTFVRTNELRGAEWDEIELEGGIWRIPAERMKANVQHVVPLSRQAVEVLQELKQLTDNRRHVFPNEHSPSSYMSENTMLYALYRMGYHSRATGHGFRSTASTILNEQGFRPDVIERQLAHTEKNHVRAAYNHAQYLPERRTMMQWWADYLDEAARKGKPDSTPEQEKHI